MKKLTLQIFLAALMVASSFFIVTPSLQNQAEAVTERAGMIIPLYVYPNFSDPNSYWNRILNAHSTYPNVPMYVVLNPSNGPGSGGDPNYVDAVNRLKNAGITALGYVPTGYAGRPLSDVKAMVNTWKTSYNPNGIFFDEMAYPSACYASTGDCPAYYADLNSYVKVTQGMSVTVGNPGALVDMRAYVNTVDIICIWENYFPPNPNGMAPYTTNIAPSTKWASLAHDFTDSSQITQSYINQLREYTAYMFFTDTNWFSVPPYFETMVSYINNGNAAPGQAPPTAVMTLASKDTSNNVITGMYVTVADASTGNVLNAGYTQTSFTLATDKSYIITANDFGNRIFDHWNTGETTRSITKTLTADVTYTAFYAYTPSPPPSPTATLTVSSKLTDGTPFTGMWTELRDNAGALIGSGFTTKQYPNLQTGSTVYEIAAADYAQYVFDHWDDGSTNRYHKISLSADKTITAFYKLPSATLTVSSKLTDGTPFTGMWTELRDSSGALIGSGWTTINYPDLATTHQYKIAAADYAQYVFDHWDNGSTNRERAVNISTDTTFTAFYRQVTQSTYDITALSKWTTGSDITGMYMQLQNSAHQQIFAGWTPVTFSDLAPGTYYLYANDFGNRYFDSWQSGPTTRELTINLNGDTNAVALYKQSPASITVTSADMLGNEITGMYMQLTDINDNQLASGWTKITFNDLGSGTYRVYANDFGNRTFDHWSDGSTARGITVNLKGDTYLVAYYRVT